MIYKQKSPGKTLSGIIKSFWMIDSEGDSTIRQEKIIPDGYPEVIFHYGDPFRSTITGEWTLQEKDLLAGQISNYFLLENTGRVGMFALKFQPWALRKLFAIKISDYTNNVLKLHVEDNPILTSIKEFAIQPVPFEKKVEAVENMLLSALDLDTEESKGELAIKLILQKNGAIHLPDLYAHVGIGERAMERYVKEYIGLSPKFYCRIIRFSHIFRLVNQGTINWSDVAFHSGFYDQSHFIKNFKEFTGEEPSKYGFTKETMANFLLAK